MFGVSDGLAVSLWLSRDLALGIVEILRVDNLHFVLHFLICHLL